MFRFHSKMASVQNVDGRYAVPVVEIRRLTYKPGTESPVANIKRTIDENEYFRP